MDKYIKRFHNKKLKIGKNHYVRINTYYLSEYDSGLRIKVKRFDLTKTVEILLIIGDDKIIKKMEIKKVTLKNPTKVTIDREVNKLIELAKELKYYKEDSNK